MSDLSGALEEVLGMARDSRHHALSDVRAAVPAAAARQNTAATASSSRFACFSTAMSLPRHRAPRMRVRVVTFKSSIAQSCYTTHTPRHDVHTPRYARARYFVLSFGLQYPRATTKAWLHATLLQW